MKPFFKNALTHCSIVVAAALLVGIAKIQEAHHETSVSRGVLISGNAQNSKSGTANPRAGLHGDSVTETAGSASSRSDVSISRQKPDATGETLSKAATSALADQGPQTTRSKHRSLTNHAEPSSSYPRREFPSGDIPSGDDQEDTIPAMVVEEARKPVVQAIPNLDVKKFTPREIEAIQQQQERFQEAINSAPDQNPDSPAYFDHWKSAQRQHDEQLRITLGWDRFNLLSAQAAANRTETP